MIDESTLHDFYGAVSPERLDRFRRFLGTHEIHWLKTQGVRVPYYACGQGSRTLLTFCGGHSTPYTAWESVESYEADHRVLVIDVSCFGSVAALCDGIDVILAHERVDRVVLMGASLAGIIAQIYLKQRASRVDGVVLMNTMALKQAGPRPHVLFLLWLMPGFALRALLRRRFRAYFKPALADPRAEDAARFGLAHLDDVMTHHFSKKKVINLVRTMSEFTREGYTRADLGDWPGRALIVVSEDDAGFKDVAWLTENLPGAEAEILPPGLGHLPQLVHRERFDRLIRDFVASLP
jgi:pimeloyl-ACP methyl ester carboxylesterase